MMRLIFTEQGDSVGAVELADDGELSGPPVWVQLVQMRMARDKLAADAAMRQLDGWSNGYLTASLEDAA